MKQAIVMSGGGAYAAYEVGVLKALMNGQSSATLGQPLNPAILTGTSAGAFNAAVMLSAGSENPTDIAAHLESVWLNKVVDAPERFGNGVYRFRGDFRKYLAPANLMRQPTAPLFQAAQDATFITADVLSRMAAFATGSEPIDRRTLELFDLSALVSTEPFDRLVRQTVSIDAIRQSNRVMHIAATNWRTGELKLFTNAGLTHDAVMASAAIPGIFPPVSIDGDPHVDGGILMNTPLSPAIEAGAGVIHAMALDPDIANVPFSTQPNTLDTIERLLNISLYGRLATDLRLAQSINKNVAQANVADEPGHRIVAIHVYRPRADMGGVFGMLNFGRSRIENLIDQGYRDALNHRCGASGCILAPAEATFRAGG